ncbi:MAG: PEP-CTERM sorting domain-containing protein [Burkholderiales bacterium]|jgi:hypothetical protein
MRPFRALLSVALAALLPTAAGAATLVSVSYENNYKNADVIDTSTSGLIRLDLDYRYEADDPITLRYRIDAAEAAAGQISFNAILRNNMSFHFWEAAVWQAAGSPVTLGDPAGSVRGGTMPITFYYHGPNGSGGYFDVDHAANGDFGEPLIAYLGNPLGESGRTDFTLKLNGLAAGAEFDVVVAIPEPESVAFLLAGLGAAAARLRRRRAA